MKKNMEHETTERCNSLVTGEAISRARTYRRAARQLHADGRINENDFRLNADISNPSQRLSSISPEGIQRSFDDLAQSLKHGLACEDERWLKSFTACHRKLLTMYARAPSPAGLGYMAIAQEEAALVLSTVGCPSAQNDAHTTMQNAANLVDSSVLTERHANWQGLTSSIACVTGTNLRKVANDLWRDNRLRDDDPRMALDTRVLRTIPLYQAPANAFMNESSHLIAQIVPHLKGSKDSVWGEDSIQKDFIALKSQVMALRQRSSSLDASARAGAQGKLMQTLASLGERSALNLSQSGKSDEALTFFTISCTAARRSYLYSERSRETGPRQADATQLN